MKQTKTIENIYIDGSSQHEKGIIGIGIFNSTTKFELSMVKNGKDCYEAEYEALQECIRYCQMNSNVQNSRIFTDSQILHKNEYDYIKALGFVDFIWIPRELNKEADRLSAYYKNSSLSTRVTNNIKIKNNSIISTTKTKTTETTKMSGLTPTQIIETLLKYPETSRRKLIDKLNSNPNRKTVYNYYFNNGPKVGKKKKTTYYYLIPLLVETKSKNTSSYINKLTVSGLNCLLKELS